MFITTMARDVFFYISVSVGIKRLVADGVYVAAYPLHEVAQRLH